MKLLALDAATEACSVALSIDSEIIERYEYAPRRHAELLLPMIDEVLMASDLHITQLDALAFGCGPGSFTGLRIAAGVVQGIAFAADLPVARVSTLAAMAYTAMHEHGVSQVAAAIDARMQEVYWACYVASADDSVELYGKEQVCEPQSVMTPIVAGEWLGVGSGWSAYGDLLKQRIAVARYWADCYPKASAIAVLGRQLYVQKKIVTAEQALPVYLRDRIAQGS